jgi:hypothetical protein
VGFAGSAQHNNSYYLKQQKAEKGKVSAYEEKDIFQNQLLVDR